MKKIIIVISLIGNLMFGSIGMSMDGYEELGVLEEYDVPATFMYSFAFTRGQLGLGAASSMVMFGAVLAIIVPYLYSELRSRGNE